MTNKQYEIRSIHKISPRHTDVDYRELPGLEDCVSGDHKAIAKVLRGAGVLQSGQRLHSARFDTATGNLVVFPMSHRGITCYPNAVVIREIVERDLYYVHAAPAPSSEGYGYARSHNIYEFMRQHHKPLSPVSAPRTYVYYVCDRYSPDRRWVEAGGFFIDAGSEHGE